MSSSVEGVIEWEYAGESQLLSQYLLSCHYYGAAVEVMRLSRLKFIALCLYWFTFSLFYLAPANRCPSHALSFIVSERLRWFVVSIRNRTLQET